MAFGSKALLGYLFMGSWCRNTDTFDYGEGNEQMGIGR
jgi:hypothetical protein